MGTPYVLPSTLINAPTGIDWSTLPVPDSTAAEQLSVQWEMCVRATAVTDAFCNMPLRATINTQITPGPWPHYGVTVDPYSGVGRMRMDNWPVLAIVSAQISAAATFPPAWTTLTAANMYIEGGVPLLQGSAAIGAAAQGSNAVDFAPGTLSYSFGKRGFLLSVTYLNGWPHAGVVAATVAGTTTSIDVDDVTGWTIATPQLPMVGMIASSAGREYVSVTGTNPSGTNASGPGTLTLAAPTLYSHAGPTSNIPDALITTLPEQVERAVIWLSLADALVRGATAITVPDLPGAEIHEKGGDGMDLLAYEQLLPFKRVTF